MFVPTCGSHDDVAFRLNSHSDISNNSVRRGKVHAHVNAGERFSWHKPELIEHFGNCVPLFTSDRVYLVPHFPVTEECNFHNNSFRARRSYRSTPSINARLLIFSAAVCASRIEPGPISRRFPVFVR